MTRSLVLVILFLGLAEFTYGLWIPAKAWLSQVLLEQAWRQTRSRHYPHKPWPWADTWPVLKLTHEASSSQVVVLAGDSGQALAFGPGFNPASHKPGRAGNTIISAHRDTHFRFLSESQIGQIIHLQDEAGKQHTYSIISQDIVDSGKTRMLIDTEDDLLTLVTCYPFDQVMTGSPLRYVVTATNTGTVAM